MFPSKKINRISYSLCIIAFFIGIIALAWNILYDCHVWHHRIFCEKHDTEGIINAFALSLSIVLLCFVSYLILHKKNTSKVLRITSLILFGIYNCAALATLVLFIFDSINYKRDYNDMRLDNQLMSEDIIKFHESVDSVIARSTYHSLYYESEPNDYMMLAARCGYAHAQNHVGVFFHAQAKKINDKRYGYNRWDESMTDYCQEELNRATYWWLKAAEQNHKSAQHNLGLMCMKAILGTQSYSYGDAKYWLTEAANNGNISAYYFLGMLCRDTSLSEAAKYFKIGAEKGNEDCMKMLENPDFIDVVVPATPSGYR